MTAEPAPGQPLATWSRKQLPQATWKQNQAPATSTGSGGCCSPAGVPPARGRWNLAPKTTLVVKGEGVGGDSSVLAEACGILQLPPPQILTCNGERAVVRGGTGGGQWVAHSVPGRGTLTHLVQAEGSFPAQLALSQRWVGIAGGHVPLPPARDLVLDLQGTHNVGAGGSTEGTQPSPRPWAQGLL